MAHTRNVVCNFTVYEDVNGKREKARDEKGEVKKDSANQEFNDFYGESDQDFRGAIKDARTAMGDEGLAKLIWKEQYVNHANAIRPTSGGGPREPSLMGKDTRETIKAAGAAGLTAAEIQAAIQAAADAKRS